MDHETAVRLQATERYLLGQLPDEDREAFEEHYFLCPVCAEDVRSALTFVDHARAIWRAENRANAAAAVPQAAVPEPKTPFWERWLPRPAFSLSLAMNAALGVSLVYLAGVQLPRLERKASAPASQFLEEITVMKPSRGAPELRQLASRQLVILSYDGADATELTYEFLNLDGNVKLAGNAGKPVIDSTGAFHLSVSTESLAPGEYDVVVFAKKAGGEVKLGPTRVRIGQ